MGGGQEETGTGQGGRTARAPTGGVAHGGERRGNTAHTPLHHARWCARVAAAPRARPRRARWCAAPRESSAARRASATRALKVSGPRSHGRGPEIRREQQKLLFQDRARAVRTAPQARPGPVRGTRHGPCACQQSTPGLTQPCFRHENSRKKSKKRKKFLVSGHRRPMLVSRPTIACPQRPMRRRRRAWRGAVGPTAAPCPPCRRPGRAPGCVRCALQCPARAWSRLRALARTACARRSGCVVSAP